MRNFYEYENVYFIGKYLQRIQIKEGNHTSCLRCALKEMCKIAPQKRSRLIRFYECVLGNYFEEI